jgi:hypothetical protein
MSKVRILIPCSSILIVALAGPVPFPSKAAPDDPLPKGPSVSGEVVHVQPRRPDFMPNSGEDDAIQRRLSTFNKQQGFEDIALDRKLKICRGC